ncbi:MAG: nucleoside 2-deoxyribosyltransferase domain-containing protein [Bacteroidota bacterium]
MQALQTFFLDFIGAVAPGSILLVGVAVALGQQNEFAGVIVKLHSFAWPVLLIATYTLGNVSVGVGGIILGDWRKSIREALKDHPSVEAFKDEMQQRTHAKLSASGNDGERDFGNLRNLALSVTDAGTSLTHRFMFIALFHLGTAVAITISAATFWLSIPIQSLASEWPKGGYDPGVAVIVSVVAIGLVCVLLLRWKEFYSRSMRVPFSTALAHLVAESHAPKVPSKTVKPSLNACSRRSRAIVYLAGGFRTGWQDIVMKHASHFSFFDPRSHGYQDEKMYTAWDTEAIRQSDIIFAYAEAENPGLYALALEIGYAKALGKMVILVEQHPDTGQRRRYFGMLRACADVSVGSLDEGLEFLSFEAKQKLAPEDDPARPN